MSPKDRPPVDATEEAEDGKSAEHAPDPEAGDASEPAHAERAEAQEPEGPAETEGEDEPEAADEPEEADAVQVVDIVADELTLGRAQLDAGLPGVAEGTILRRLAWLEADGAGVSDETDALRALLAEALWRQGRPAGARRALEAIRPSSPQRRLPIIGIVEADVLAAAGERDRAEGAMERTIDAIGADVAFEMRGSMPGALTWPLPTALRAEPPPASRAPWGAPAASEEAPDEADDRRVAAARAGLEEARVAYVAGDHERGDMEMSIALRLEPSIATEGVAILEPTLGGQSAPERLLLYGDLLRAAGRQAEADEAYDRAAGRRS